MARDLLTVPSSPVIDEERVYTTGQWQLIWIRFKKHRLAMTGGVVVLVFYLVALFAEFLAPYDPKLRESSRVQMAPMALRVRDHDGNFRAPFSYDLTKKRNLQTLELIYTADHSNPIPLRFLVRGDSYVMWGLWKADLHLFSTGDGARVYLLGGDLQGRDLLSRIIYGTRVSLSIGLVGVALSFVLGIVIGAISGYLGGVTDFAIQRLIEILISIPSLPLWMALGASIPLEWSVYQVFFAISLVLSLMAWPGLAREVRGKLLSLRGEEFVISARVDGCGDGRIMFRHLIPSFLSHIIVSGTLAIPGMIIGETSLSFLGLGLQAPAISWGVLLKAAQNIKAVVSVPWLLIPALFVVVTVLAFSAFGDGLRDAADPYG